MSRVSRRFLMLILLPLVAAVAACNPGQSGTGSTTLGTSTSGGGGGGGGGGGSAPPTDVTSLTATPTGISGQIRLTWTDSNSANVADYVIDNPPGSPALGPITVAASAQTSYSTIVPALSDGTAYTIRLRARNAGGLLSAGVTVAATPYVLTDVSNIVATATGAGGQVRLTWTGGAAPAVDSFLIDNATGTTAFAPVTVTAAATTSYAATVDGLTNGTLYTFRVRAQDGYGNLTAGVTATATPFLFEVTNVVATPVGASGRIQVTWTGSRCGNVASYAIDGAPGTPSFTEVSVTAVAQPDDANTYDVTLKELTDGTAYTLRIRTVDDNDDKSSGVILSYTVTPFMYEVTGFTATATGVSGEALLAWTGSQCPNLTKYVIGPYPGAPSFTTITISATGPDGANTYSRSVTGLTDDTLYTFWIRVQDGDSNTSAGVTAATTPFVLANPSMFVAMPTGTSGQVHLTWTASPSASAASYVISNAPGTPAFTAITVPSTGAPTYAADVNGLTNYTQYTFRLQAQDALNRRSVGVTATAIPFIHEVTNFVAIATGAVGQVLLTWTGTRCGNVVDYYVDNAPGTPAVTPIIEPAAAAPDDANTHSVLVNGLTSGTEYTFRVRVRDGVPQYSTGVTARCMPFLYLQAAPHGGIYPGPVSVIFNFVGSGTVRYTEDGTDPAPSPTPHGTAWVLTDPPVALNNDPLKPVQNTRLKYILDLGGGMGSPIQTDIYEKKVGVDPRFNKFSGMRKSRIGHTATQMTTAPAALRDNVLVVGGLDLNYRPPAGVPPYNPLLDEPERFDSAFEHFDPAPLDAEQRWNHAASVLNGGSVLVVGGQAGSILVATGALNPFSPTTASNTVSIYQYNAGTDAFTVSSSPVAPFRFYHTATRLYDGRVLITGGLSGAVKLGPLTCINKSGNSGAIDLPVATNLTGVYPGDLVEILSGPAARQVATVAGITEGDPAIPGSVDTVSISGLSSLVYGWDTLQILSGFGQGTGSLFTAAGAPAPSPNPMWYGRFGHTATILDDGTVFIAGGINDLNSSNDMEAYGDRMTEIFDWTFNSFFKAGAGDAANLHAHRFFHTATKLKDGKVLIAGGIDRGDAVFHAAGPRIATITATAEIYDPATKTTATVGTMTKSRFMHAATLLDDGRVLLTGGIIAFSTNATPIIGETADLYDPVAQKFSSVLTNDFRGHNCSVTLSDGRALILGGGSSVANIASDLAELFDPAANTFNATAHGIGGERTIGAASTVMPDGRILITGGQTDVRMGSDRLVEGPFLATAELYSMSSISSRFTPGTMAAGRRFHTSTRLVDPSISPVKASWHGKILIAGGENDIGAVAGCELFDPYSKGFTSTAPLRLGRYNHTATWLADGRVLVTGGGTVYAPLNTAEIYNPVTGTWSDALNAMSRGRTKHVAVLIPPTTLAAGFGGKVLVLGGNNLNDATAELFNPATNRFEPMPGGFQMNAGRRGFAAVARSYVRGFAWFTNGSATVTGFDTDWVAPSNRPIAGDLIMSNADGAFYTIASVDSATQITLDRPFAGLSTIRYQPYTAIKAEIFIAGGEIGSTVTDRFDPSTGLFTVGPALTGGRHYLTLDGTADGRFLAAGGGSASAFNGDLINLSAGVPVSYPTDANGEFIYHYSARPPNGIVLIFRAHSAQIFFTD
jgi:hypothetical protein